LSDETIAMLIDRPPTSPRITMILQIGPIYVLLEQVLDIQSTRTAFKRLKVKTSF
jgi:hypothetical protein